jgi:hypothetical protein
MSILKLGLSLRRSHSVLNTLHRANPSALLVISRYCIPWKLRWGVSSVL